MKRKLNAFTLIELLTVIAIVSILMAMVLPAISSAKDKAYQVTCGSNLAQLGKAIDLYQQDFEDRFPLALDLTDYPLLQYYAYSGIPHAVVNVKRLEFQLDPLDGDWNGGRIDHVLRPYLRSEQVMRCPGDTGFGGITGAADDKSPFLYYNKKPIVPLWQQSRNYRFHGRWGGTSYLYRTELGLWMKPVDQLRKPSDTNVLMDATHYWHAPLHRYPIESPSENLDMKDANKGHFNTLFADGHISFITWRDNVRVWSTRSSDYHYEYLWNQTQDLWAVDASAP